MRISKEEAGLIVQNYRLAKNREEQIKIEAELFATDTAEIRGILYAAGAYNIGHDEIERALQILKQGGKNRTLGTLRSWLAGFKTCSAKEARRILLDYKQRPWAEPIPDAEFKEALHIYEIGKEKGEEMAEEAKEILVVEEKTAPEAENKQRQTEEKAPAAHGFSQEEQKMIFYGLTGLYVEKEAMWRKLQKEADHKRQRMEAAQREYNEVKNQEDMAAAELAKLEALINRINGGNPEETKSAEDLWEILSGEKQQQKSTEEEKKWADIKIQK